MTTDLFFRSLAASGLEHGMSIAAASRALYAVAAEMESPLVSVAAAERIVRSAAGTKPDRWPVERAVRAAAARTRAALARITVAIEAAYGHCSYRQCRSAWVSDTHSVSIDVGEPSARSETGTKWSRNGKWSATTSWHRLNVRSTWLRDVHARGIAVVDDQFVVDATPIHGEAGCYTALAVRQGRGAQIEPERVVVATHRTGEQVVSASAPIVCQYGPVRPHDAERVASALLLARRRLGPAVAAAAGEQARAEAAIVETTTPVAVTP